MKPLQCLEGIAPLMGKSYIQLVLSQLVLPQCTPGWQSKPQTTRDECALPKQFMARACAWLPLLSRYE